MKIKVIPYNTLEYASLDAFPATGESGKHYLALDTMLLYTWSSIASQYSRADFRYEGRPVYHGSYLKSGYLEFTMVASPTLIDWHNGDYIRYDRTGRIYKLYGTPQVERQASTNHSGESFAYRNVQFYDKTKDLSLVPFRDLVPGAGGAQYYFSSKQDVAFTGTVANVVERLNANLANFFGTGVWNVRIADNIPESFEVSIAKDFSVSGMCQDALNAIYETWHELGWAYAIENGVDTIIIGYPNIAPATSGNRTNIFSYDNGLTALKRNNGSMDNFCTRMHVYGTERNLINRYYNGKDIYNAESVNIPNLMIPIELWGQTSSKPDANKAFIEDADKIEQYGLITKDVYFDGTDGRPEIYPSIEQQTIEILKAAKTSLGKTGAGAPDYYPQEADDTIRVDQVKAAVQMPQDDGTPTNSGEKYIDTYDASIASTLVDAQSASSRQSHSVELFEYTFVDTGVVDIRWNGALRFVLNQALAEGDYLTLKLCVYQSEVSRNTLVASADFDVDSNVTNGQILNLDRVLSVGTKTSQVTGNFIVTLEYAFILSGGGTRTITITKEGDILASANIREALVANFKIKTHQIGFDIAKMQSSGGAVIAVKSGMCAGREFSIVKAIYNSEDDDWTLTCKRSQDTSTQTYYPNATFAIAADDEFVILGITMPEEYILAQAHRLYTLGQELFDRVSVFRPTFEPSIDSKKVLENITAHPSDEQYKLVEGKYMRLYDEDLIADDHNTDVMISEITINEGEAEIATYHVVLSDKANVTGGLSRTVANISTEVENIQKAQRAQVRSQELGSQASSPAMINGGTNVTPVYIKDGMPQPIDGLDVPESIRTQKNVEAMGGVSAFGIANMAISGTGGGGTVTAVSVNGNRYTPSNGLITLPDYPTAASLINDGLASRAWAYQNFAAKDYETRVQAIEALIPAQASSENQVADKAFVNSSVATATAEFQGTYDVVEDLGLTASATHAQIQAALLTAVASRQPDNNDYVFVSIPAVGSASGRYERYKFNGTSWAYEYTLNNSSFTAAQWGSINSGITENKVSGYDAHLARTDNPHSVTKAQVGLGNVENTALSTWVGTNNITTLGTITTGVWHGSAIGDSYIASASVWNAKQNALAFDGTYDASTNKVATKSTVTNAINALDVSNISGFGAGKTLASLTETDGKIAATFQDISITKSQVSDFPTTWALTDVTGADDLKAIEALTGTSGFLKKIAANTWSLDTDVASGTALSGVSTRVGTLEGYFNSGKLKSANIDLATGDDNGQVKIAGTNVSVKGWNTAATHAHGDYVTAVGIDATNGKLKWYLGGVAQTAPNIVAARLVDTNKTMFGNTYWTSSGIPASIGTANAPAALDYVTNIDGLLYFDKTNRKVEVGTSASPADIQSFGGVSAMGIANMAINGGGGQGTLTQIKVNGTAIADVNGVVNITATTGNANGKIAIAGQQIPVYGLGTLAYASSLSFDNLSSHPTTLGGYGITDAKIANGVITLGSNTITPLTSHQTLYNLVINNSAGTAQITYKPAVSGTYALTLTKAMVGLGNVENTALSTWAGSANITTLGTITTGTWNGTAISDNYIASAATWNAKQDAISDLATIRSRADEGHTAYGYFSGTGNTLPNNKLVNSSISIAGTLVSLGGSISAATLKSNLSLGASAYVDYDTEVTQDSTKLITSGAVYNAIDNLPEPMIMKGTLGTNGTITSLPTASASNEGFTYKVITAGTYASQAAKVGDVFVSCKPVGASAYEWILIPAGDTDSDTWRNIKVNGTQLLGTAISSGAVNFKNGGNITLTGSGNDITLGVASGYAIPTTAKQGNWDTAYGWGNHANAGYALAANLGTASTHAHEDYVTAITYDSINRKLQQSKGGGTATDIVTFGTNAFNSTAFLPLAGGTMANTNLVTNLNAEYLGGTKKADLFTAFANDNDQLSSTIGGTNKKVTVGYASRSTDTKTELLTEQEFIYRQTAGGALTYKPSAAVIKRVLGNTLVWNQLAPKYGQTTLTYNGITWSHDGNGFVTGNNTSTGVSVSDGGALLSVKCYASHKYYFGAFGPLTSNVIPQAFTNNGNRTLTVGIAYAPVDGDYYIRIRVSSGQTLSNAKFFLFLYDLTLMFGAGNEPSTVEEFEALYPNAYYEYNAGTIINNAASGLESVGFNLWDEQWELGVYNQQGQKTDNNSAIRSVGKINVSPNTTYHCHCASRYTTGVIIRYYDLSGNYLSTSFGKNITFTTPSNCYKIALCTFADDGITTYNHDICINLSDSTRNGQYEPYKKNVLPLFPLKCKAPNGDIVIITDAKSAGSVRDERVGKKFIQRVGSVDLGTLNWGIYDGYNTFYTNSLVDLVTAGSDSGLGDFICSRYATDAVARSYTDCIDKTVSKNSQKFIRIKDTSYSSASTFKTAMSGVYLNYALATPIEYEIIDEAPYEYPIDVLGTERIVSDELVAPFVADIQYGAEQRDIAVDINNLHISAGLLSNRASALESYFTDGIANNAARLSNTSAIGSTTKPVYFTANGVPSACSDYAGGTAVTLNGSSKAANTASFYAPTGAGSNGNILQSTGGTPSWVTQSTLVAGKATILETTRTLWGQNFNGSANVTGDMTNVGTITPSADKQKNLGSESLQFNYVYASRLITNSGNGLRYCSTTGKHAWYNSYTTDDTTKQMELTNSALTIYKDVQGMGGVSAMGIASMAINSMSGISFASQIAMNGQTYNATSGLITLPNFTDAYNPSGTGSTTQALSQKGAKALYNAVIGNIPTSASVAGWGYKKGMVYSTSTASDSNIQVATGADPTYQYVTNTSQSTLILVVTTSNAAANSYGVHRYIMIYNNRSSATLVQFADQGQGVVGPADNVSIPANSYMEFRIIHPASNAKCMVTWSTALKNIDTM